MKPQVRRIVAWEVSMALLDWLTEGQGLPKRDGVEGRWAVLLVAVGVPLFFVLFLGNLALLSWAEEVQPGLSSWVPDWLALGVVPVGGTGAWFLFCRRLQRRSMSSPKVR